MKDVCIMTVCQNIPLDVIRRFRKCIELSKPNCSYDIHFLSDDNMLNFNKSKLLNNGIKKLSKKNYKVIIQADIDLIVPPGIIDKSLEFGSLNKTCFYNNHRRINPNKLPLLPKQYIDIIWEEFSKFPYENAAGCWNAMSPDSWLSSGGYNEYMIEWGREDDAFRRTSEKYGNINFINYNQFCLIHYNHQPRTKDMRFHNQQMEEKAEKDGKINWLI